MNIGFYFIKSNFFKLVNSGLEWMDSKTNKHMYFVLPFKNELWAIPLSSQYDKYKNWYREAFDRNNKHLTLPLDLIQFVEKRLKLMNTYEEKGILSFHADLSLIRNILHKDSGKL